MANHNQTKGLRRIINAFGYSMAGFRSCYKHEEAFRQELILSLVMIPLAIWLGNDGMERALLVGSVLFVPIVELLNSAIEANVDRVGMEKHKLSKRAKDIASAAVFLSIVLTISVWGLILGPRYI
jgi:diacylglycerol kinase (ATP)